MKNFIIFLVLVACVFIFFVPQNVKVNILDTVGIDSSIIGEEESGEIVEERIINLKFDEQKQAFYNSDVSKGELMTDFSWATMQYVKCFSPSDINNFNGKMKMHRVLLGKKKDINVKLTSEKELNMFVYKTDPLSKVYPPEKEYFHDCISKIGEGNVKEVDMGGNTITSDIVIGVAGGSGTLDGSYTLELLEK